MQLDKNLPDDVKIWIFSHLFAFVGVLPIQSSSFYCHLMAYEQDPAKYTRNLAWGYFFSGQTAISLIFGGDLEIFCTSESCKIQCSLTDNKFQTRDV